MELKDVNNALASLMNFGKPPTSNFSAPVVGAGFADLLKNEPTADAPVTKETRDIRDVKERSRDERKVRNDDKPINNKKINNGKNDNKNKNNVEHADAPVTEDLKANNQTSSSGGVDKSTNVDENISTAPVQGVVSDQAVADDAVTVEDTPALAAGEGDVLEDLSTYAIPLDVLALMGVINVVNPQTGDVTITTGSELATLLAQSQEMVAMHDFSAGDNVTIQLVPAAPQNVVKVPVEGKLDISGMDLVEDGEVFNLNTANMAQVKKNDQVQSAVTSPLAEDIVDENLGEKVSKIADIIGGDQKLKVKVSVDEEKIAQLDAKSLVADAKAVDDAVAQSVDQIVTTPKTGDGAQVKQAQSGFYPNLNLNFNVAPIVNATPIVPTAESTITSVSVNPVEINSATLSNATATGGEFVKAAKAEVAGENASFKDVYKGMSKEVADQVRVNITKSAVKGIDKIDITLKPEDLGHIEIKMQIGKDGKLQAHLISSRPETMEALQKEMQSLEKAFNDAGFQTDEGSLSFSFRDGGQANQNQERENGLRNFIGDIFEKETSTELLSGDAFQNQSWDGKSGLNIRV